MSISLHRLADFVNAAEVVKEMSKNTNLLEHGRGMVHLDLPSSPGEGRYKDDKETSADEEKETMEETTRRMDGMIHKTLEYLTWREGCYFQALNYHSFD